MRLSRQKFFVRNGDLIPLFVLFLLGTGYFFPVFFLGRAPAVNSLRNSEPWRSEWVRRGDAVVEQSLSGAPVYRFNTPEAFADDLNRQFIPWGLYAQKRLKSGDLPLWNPHVACGQPLFANHQTGLTNPLILLCYYLFPGLSAFTAIFFSVFVLMGWGMYAYLRVLGLGRGPSLLGAASYQFMLGYIPTLDTLVVEKALFPFMLYSAERLVRAPGGKGGLWVVLTVVLMALVLTSAHAQEAVYISYMFAPYLILVAGEPQNFRKGVFWRTVTKRLVLTLAIYVLSVLISLFQNLPTLEFYRLSARAMAFREQLETPSMLEQSLTWIQSLMIAFPRLFGDYIRHDRFLEHYLLNYGYVGMVTLVAGVFAGWIKGSRRQVWFWRIVAFVSLVSLVSNWFYFDILCRLPLFRVSLQKPFSPLFFSLTVLGAAGLEFLLSPKPKLTPENRALGRTALLVYAAALGFGVLYVSHLFLPKAPDIDDRTYAFGQILLGTLVAAVVCLVISLYWARAGSTRPAHPAVVAALLFVILLDLWPLKAHFNPFVRREDLFMKAPLTDFLSSQLAWSEGEHGGPFRFGRSWREVLPPNTGMMYGIDDFGGYDSNLVGVYGKLLEGLDESIMEGVHFIETPLKRAAFESKIWNLLGVKYVVGHPGHSGQFAPPERWLELEKAEVLIVENLDALPRVHLVETVWQCVDEEEALRKTLEIDPSAEAVVLRENPIPVELSAPVPTSSSPGSAAITRYLPEDVTVHVSSSRPALLCFFDVWFPGWEVHVDGRPEAIERVDFAFKGVFVPAGEHDVRFSYRPKSLKYGLLGTLLGIALLALFSRQIARVC